VVSGGKLWPGRNSIQTATIDAAASIASVARCQNFLAASRVKMIGGKEGKYRHEESWTDCVTTRPRRATCVECEEGRTHEDQGPRQFSRSSVPTHYQVETYGATSKKDERKNRSPYGLNMIP
jgi:hypothetical protein